jgi:hypothetical protein
MGNKNFFMELLSRFIAQQKISQSYVYENLLLVKWDET